MTVTAPAHPLASDPAARPAGRPAARVLGRRASFWVSAGVVGHTLWTSAAPAMTYPLYAAQWGLTHLTLTAIFATYPAVVVAVLVGFGDLSDHVGRRATMLLGLGASLAGVLLFALAPSVAWLFAGRALMGLGVGLSVGPATAALVEFAPEDRPDLAGSVTTAAQAAGFAASLLLGGLMVQYAPLPTRLSFWLLAAIIAALLAATWFLPGRRAGDAGRGWRPRLPRVPRALRTGFAVAALGVVTAYTHGVLILSLGAQVARDLVGSGDALVNAAALALFAVASGIVGILARHVVARVALMTGALASAAGMMLLAVSVHTRALGCLLAATSISGVGYGLLFLGGLEVINRITPSSRRGGVFSALYLLGYLSMAVVALLLGHVATLRGLSLATDLGAGIIALFSVGTAALATTLLPFEGQGPRCDADVSA
ncbi:hypothetical protein OPKNFCMD_5822 [Methylobacterium crusticola]|uniref:Major facilitator superfamily (MFS) profile domain-containing protein n=1 Tax=Methylobacterium crusticola TaxID=1697972 RepID=A0ABQ4R6U9_9HYPH|nr:MFS transporter [Methylobacterium crusticola]GJD53051.1 hypothetical protein OPKNFCMD_5822 [Methylobacterium crusticola]